MINTQTYLTGPSLATKAYQNLAPKGKTAEGDSTDTPSESFQLSDPSNFPTLVKAAQTSTIERIFPNQSSNSLLATGLKITGDCLLGIEGAGLTFFANGTDIDCGLHDGSQHLKLKAEKVIREPELEGQISQYLVGLPDGTKLEIMELGQGSQIHVSRHQGDYEQAFEASFVPEGATEMRMDQARFATDGVGNAIILNDPTGPLASAVLLQNQPMGDLTLQRSARSRGLNAIVLQRGETVSETPEMTQLQLAMMADMVLSKTDFLTHPQSLTSL